VTENCFIKMILVSWQVTKVAAQIKTEII